MSKTTYTLLGAGGTGSILFDPLLRYLSTYHRGRKEECNLQVIDGDEIERKNLDRQAFADPAIGMNKAEALVRSATFVPPNVKLIAVPQMLGKDNITKRIRDGDVVLIAVDNYPVRALVEEHGKTLKSLVVVNGGNEATDGSCQLWIRREGKNVTPPLSHMHPEIVYEKAADRATMTCAAISKIPGGEQTIIANMMSATTMLNMLRHSHQNPEGAKKGHEVHFDMETLGMRADDWRGIDGWKD